jgi:hypothetical protein
MSAAAVQDELLLRARIVDVAKSWLGTPFVDNQGLKHCGVDCAYLLARVMEEAGICGRITIPHYSPQIYLNRLGDDTYIRLLSQCAREIEEREVKPGDFVLYKQAQSYTHGGIIERWPDSIIHPLRPHGVMCSAAWEGFLKLRAHKFFSVFGKDKS